MKKIFTTLSLAVMLAVTPLMPTPAVAAPLPAGVGDVESSELLASLEFSEFKPCPRGTFRVRRNTRTKKKLVNSLIAGGVGAAIGGGIGGKRGALIGAGTGAGGYLTYRYIRDRRGRCVARRV